MYRLVTAFGVTAYLTVLIQPQGSTFFTSRGAPPPRADALAPLHSVVSRTERHSGGAVADVHSSSQESATTSYLRSESYLGSESCAHCHDGEYDSWRKTLHIQMTKPIAEARVEGDFRPGTRLQAYGRTYTMESRDKRYFISVARGGRPK